MGIMGTMFKGVVAYNTCLVAFIAVAVMCPPNLVLVPAFDAIDRFLNWCDDSATAMAANKFYHGLFTALTVEGSHRRAVTAHGNAAGSIPVDLDGIFLRNGPNPQHPPIGKYHMFDGDGMVHAVRLSGGNSTAMHTNSWVKTPIFKEEKAAGRSRYLKVGELSGRTGLVKILALEPLKRKLGAIRDIPQLESGKANTVRESSPVRHC